VVDRDLPVVVVRLGRSLDAASQLRRVAEQRPHPCPFLVGATNVADAKIARRSALCIGQATTEMHDAAVTALPPFAERWIANARERLLGHVP
jgi:hypothetical protein